MQDMLVHLEKLRRHAIECQLISDLATEPDKRALFARLALDLNGLANEVQKAITARKTIQFKAAREPHR